MKIYFAGSIRGGRSDVKLYGKIIDYLKNYGKVLTEHIGNPNLSSEGESGLSDNEIHNRDMKWLISSDVIVAEVSTPSLGVGYEIGRSVGKKRILCLFKKSDKRLSAMINGCKDLNVKEYSDINSAKEIIDDFFKKSITNPPVK